MANEEYEKEARELANKITEVIQGKGIDVGMAGFWLAASNMISSLEEDSTMDNAEKVECIETMLECNHSLQLVTMQKLIKMIGATRTVKIMEDVRKKVNV